MGAQGEGARDGGGEPLARRSWGQRERLARVPRSGSEVSLLRRVDVRQADLLVRKLHPRGGNAPVTSPCRGMGRNRLLALLRAPTCRGSNLECCEYPAGCCCCGGGSRGHHRSHWLPGTRRQATSAGGSRICRHPNRRSRRNWVWPTAPRFRRPLCVEPTP